ncbi:MAG: hypothetical protein ACYTCU_01525 [Planctomycetota bacterium]|jgi:hypothetical protein
MFDEDFVRQVYEEAVEALDQGAGIRLREPVPALLLTVDQARERRKAFAKELDEGAGLTAGQDLVADLVFSGSILGRYLPDEKVLYIIEEVLERASGGSRSRAEEMLFGVMAHELVHAYDDQVYQVMPGIGEVVQVAADGTRMPELQALMGLIEGRATYASELACAHAGKTPLSAPTVESARRYKVMEADDDNVAASVGSGLVNALARTKMMQYAQGREFAKQAFDFGGEKFFEQVFTHLPLSLAELEDFNRFKLRWARQVEEAMDAEDAEAAADAP